MCNISLIALAETVLLWRHSNLNTQGKTYSVWAFLSFSQIFYLNYSVTALNNMIFSSTSCEARDQAFHVGYFTFLVTDVDSWKNLVLLMLGLWNLLCGIFKQYVRDLAYFSSHLLTWSVGHWNFLFQEIPTLSMSRFISNNPISVLVILKGLSHGWIPIPALLGFHKSQ